MTTITDKAMATYNDMEIGTHFLYDCGCGEFFAIKIHGGAVLINADNKFIIAKAYKNCLSIGSGVVSEFDSFTEAVACAEFKIDNVL